MVVCPATLDLECHASRIPDRIRAPGLVLDSCDFGDFRVSCDFGDFGDLGEELVTGEEEADP